MSYATQSEFEARFGEGELIDLADRDGDGIADAEVVAAAITGAAELIDSYLQSRFPVPLAETPGLIHKCALFIMRYDLAQDHATDRVKDDYAQALKWLEAIRDGKMDIGLTPAGKSRTRHPLAACRYPAGDQLSIATPSITGRGRQMADIYTAAKTQGFRNMRKTLREIVKSGEDNRELLDAFGQTLGEAAVHRLAVTNEGPDGQAWAPSARSERTGGKIQYNTGMAGLAGSLTHRVIPDAVEVGSPLVYAAQRQFGGTILPKRGEFLAFPELDDSGKQVVNDEGKPQFIVARSVTQPARPYLGVSADDADELAGLALDFLDGIMAAGEAGQGAAP